MSSWFTKVFPTTHNFIKCSEIVYSEFTEIICNTALY